MNRAGQVLTLDCSTTYRIEVQGYLDENRSAWFDGLTIEPRMPAEDASITTLTGQVIDQAALHGLLRKLYVLGLPLLSVQRLEPESIEDEKVG